MLVLFWFSKLKKITTILLLSVAFLLPSFALADNYDLANTNAPAIRSSEFPDESLWYNSVGGTFSWNLPKDVTAVALDFATTSGKEPETPYRPPISSYTVDVNSLQEGTQYLIVQFRDSDGWGDVAEQKIQIDLTPPQPFSITAEAHPNSDDITILSFQTEDSLSGIAYYQVYAGDQPAVTLSPEEANKGYRLNNSDTKAHYVHVVAYDSAGNGTASSLAILGIKGHNAVGLTIGNLSPEPLLVALLTTIVLVLFGYLFYERRRYANQEASLNREVLEIKSQKTKIFTALRHEIHDQIRAITKKKRLSKGEKEAVEGLNRALQVSETLIEKEIKDVKDMLK